MPKITFFLRSNKDIKQTHSVYCRVTYRGTKCEFSLKEKIEKSYWCQKSQNMKGNSPQSKFINLLLEKTAYKIKTHSITNKLSSAKELILTINEPPKTITAIDALKKYTFVRDVSPATKQKYKNVIKNITLFEKYIGYKLNETNFTLPIAEQYKNWFCKTKNTSNIGTACRNINLQKSAFDLQLKNGSILSHGLINYQGERDPKKEVVFLTSKEVESIENAFFMSKLLNGVRDVFLFQIYTGLSYSDIWHNWKITSKNTQIFISGKRYKNNQEYIVPISQKCQALLKKHNYKLPKYENQVCNRLIKEIVALCGINKKVSTHTARKTFATLQDGNGWSRESISRMLAHKSIKTTESYYMGANIERVINESNSRL